MQRDGQRNLARGRGPWLTIAIEAVVENYREYRDYNTTTTHSDHGEMLYTLVDFLRLRADYDRVAWNLKPVVMAHEILVRQNRPAAAEMWQQALAERTAEAADANLASFEKLCDEYGIRLASIAERLAERFTRPLAIDRVRALVPPAMDAAGVRRSAPRLPRSKQEIDSLAREPAGAGLGRPRLALGLGGRGLDGPLREAAPRNRATTAAAADRAGSAELGRTAAAVFKRRGLGSFCRPRLVSGLAGLSLRRLKRHIDVCTATSEPGRPRPRACLERKPSHVRPLRPFRADRHAAAASPFAQPRRRSP